VRIFVSHARERAEIADRVVLSLRKAGHQVFLDRDALPGGGDYDTRIRDEVGRCSLLVFLVSPEAVEPGAYSLTELGYARDRWPDPTDHVLPVMVAPTAFEHVPPYLAAVTILTPEGNVAAEVTTEVEKLTRQRRVRLVRVLSVVSVVGLAAALLAPRLLELIRRDGDTTGGERCLLAVTLEGAPSQVRLSTTRLEVTTHRGAEQSVLNDAGRSELDVDLGRSEPWRIDVRDLEGVALVSAQITGCPKESLAFTGPHASLAVVPRPR
jgi:hypothetical protein